MRWQIQKGTYRLKLQRTWSLFELINSQIFANKIFPTKRLCWWNESCGFYVNIMGAIKQIQWSALIRISSSMSRCFTSLNYLCIIWENSRANWRLCLYLSCNPPSEGESFHPFGIITNYTGRMFLQVTALQFLFLPLSFGNFHPDDLQPSKTERRPAFWMENNRILDYIDWFG